MKMKVVRSKKRVNWLIGLMTLSLIGITGIQAYWLNNSYHLEEEKFDQKVSEALQGVSTRLERLETISFIEQNFNLNSLFSSSYSDFKGRRVRSKDSVFSLGNKGEGYQVAVQISDDSTVFLDNETPPSGAIQTWVKENEFPVIDQKKRVLEVKLQRMDAVFSKMMQSSFFRNGGLKNRLTKEELDSLLDYELLTRGIKIDYEYLVVENDRPVIGSRNANSVVEQPKEECHEAALFPDDFMARSSLLVHFPSKAKYLLGSMWLTLFTSLVLTLAIIYTFARTVSYSLQQKRISEIKTDFINNMTHEFKTPIATISLAIDALKNPKVINDPKRIEHYSAVIKQENNRMNMQVESVLRMALMDKKELELNFEEWPVSEILEACAAHIQLALENRNGKLDCKFNDGKTALMLDRNHFSNTIINILDNAIKYSNETPEIKIATEVTQNHLIVIISDKGVGMSKEEQKHIFNRFYRVSSGNIHDIKGHGLGLSYANGIVQAHGGRIEVESEKGQGSKFYLYFPV